MKERTQKSQNIAQMKQYGCRNCAFWMKDEKFCKLANIGIGDLHGCGDCRRNPPFVVGTQNGNIESHWPVTDGSDWCGAGVLIEE